MTDFRTDEEKLVEIPHRKDKFIIVRVFLPDEGYDDVCDDLVLVDFMNMPQAFRCELLQSEEER